MTETWYLGVSAEIHRHREWKVQRELEHTIMASTKGGGFAHYKLCSRDFFVSHGGHKNAYLLLSLVS